MQKELVLLSVPHTGTNVLRRIFTDHGYEMRFVNDAPETEQNYYFAHTTNLADVQRGLQLAKRMPIVCPMRHPFRVEESWRRRQKDLSHGFWDAWHHLRTMVIPAGCFVMPVDVPDRDEHLGRLGDLLGVRLTTDWPLCRSRAGTHDLPLSETNPSPEVRNMASELGWLLDRYYVGC